MRPDRAPLRPALPAIIAWLCLAIGFLLADLARETPPELWLGGTIVAGAAALAIRGRAALVLLAIGATFFAAGYFQWRILPAPAPDAAWITDRAIVQVEGVLREDPAHGPPNPGAFAPFVNLPPVARFTLRVDRLIDGAGERRVNADALVRVGETVAHVRAGDRVRISGFFTPIRPPMNPGERDARRWANQQNVMGRLIASSRDNVVALPPRTDVIDRFHAGWFRFKANLRDRAGAWLNDAVGEAPAGDPARATLVALLLGDREDASMRQVSQAMQRIGVAHLLSISGLHLGALVWLLVVALRACGVRGGAEAILIALVVLLYMTLIPVRTPIVRAGVMALAFLGAEAAGRRYHPLAVLVWTGVAVLLWRPLELWSPGYQLSFGVVAAIITLPPRIERRLHPIDLEPDAMTTRRWITRKIEQAVIVALCAWLVAAPTIIHHFGVFSLIGAVASVALFPLVVIVIGLGAGAILLAALLPTIAQTLGAALEAIASILATTTLWLDDAPFSAIHLPPVSAWWAIGATILIARALFIPTWRGWREPALIGVAILWLALHGTPLARPRIDGVRIDTLNVDDGACHLIRSGNDAILWDAGSRLLWFGERDLPRALRALGAWPIRTIVLSHPNLDHYSAIPDLIRPFRVRDVALGRAVIDAAEDDPLGPVAHLLERIAAEGMHLRVIASGDTLPLGDATLEFIHPEAHERWPDHNDASLVALARVPTPVGPRTAMFSGDIERAAMSAIRRRWPDLRPDVLEAPHHGSARPFAIRFVDEIDPFVVIQSTGIRRADDDRWERIRSSRVWLTTATDGAITVHLRRDGEIAVSTMRSPKERLVTESSERSTGTAR